MDILLEKGEMLVVNGSRQGCCARCEAGTLWITQKGDSRDHLLRSGGGFQSFLSGRIVVTALSAARFSLQVDVRSLRENEGRTIHLKTILKNA